MLELGTQMQIKATGWEPGKRQFQPRMFPWLCPARVTAALAPSQRITWKSRGSLQQEERVIP